MTMELGEILRRRVARARREGDYVRTLNLHNRVRIRFVWYPGSMRFHNSLVDTFVQDTAGGTRRSIWYTWEREGQAPIRRPLNSGEVTVPLPPGATGTLSAFGTRWEITRAAAGVTMRPASTLRGVQQRLNHLGYHLRARGATVDGVDGALGRRTERCILQFQADYDHTNRPHIADAAIAAAAPNARLFVRGEWDNNPDLNTGGDPNPSAADGANLQAALRAVVGQ